MLEVTFSLTANGNSWVSPVPDLASSPASMFLFQSTVLGVLLSKLGWASWNQWPQTQAFVWSLNGFKHRFVAHYLDLDGRRR